MKSRSNMSTMPLKMPNLGSGNTFMQQLNQAPQLQQLNSKPGAMQMENLNTYVARTGPRSAVAISDDLPGYTLPYAPSYWGPYAPAYGAYPGYGPSVSVTAFPGDAWNVQGAWSSIPKADNKEYFSPGNMVSEAARLPVIQQALHDAASIASAQAGVISSVADAVEPGTGSIVKSAAEGLITADRLANSMIFDKPEYTRVEEINYFW